MRSLEACVLAQLDVHFVVDNYATHKASQGAHLAGASPSLPHALHPDLLVVDELSGTLVRSHHPASDSPGIV